MLGISILMIVVLGWIAYDNNEVAEDVVIEGRKVSDTLSLLNEIEKKALELETGGRGFVITGDERFLPPYELALTDLANKVPQLKQALGADEKYSEGINSLEELIELKIAQTRRNMDVRREAGLEVAVDLVSRGEGRAYMEDIRVEVAGMRNLLAESRTKALDQISSRLGSSSWVMPVLAGIGGFALVLASFFVYGENSRRRKAEALILEANEMLEKRVVERTLALNKVNDELKRILDERGRLLDSEKEARGQAEVANKIRDEFMAALSHELRNPLNSILGWARILKRDDLDEQVITKAVDAIISSSETQSNLIDDLLDIGRIVSGKLRFEMRPVNPSDLLRGAVDSFQPIAASKGIRISQTIAPELSSFLLSGDLNRLRQAIWNLLSNALKFSDSESEILIEAELIEGEVQIRVKDDGMGIRAEFLPFIFDRFRQDAPTRDFSSGLGLGLPIVRAITEIHGGRVTAFSEGEGRGSTFTIYLPIADVAEVSRD
jgi:signal transduction histidine kinase